MLRRLYEWVSARCPADPHIDRHSRHVVVGVCEHCEVTQLVTWLRGWRYCVNCGEVMVQVTRKVIVIK